jgi:hypothetical protein
MRRNHVLAVLVIMLVALGLHRAAPVAAGEGIIGCEGLESMPSYVAMSNTTIFVEELKAGDQVSFYLTLRPLSDVTDVIIWVNGDHLAEVALPHTALFTIPSDGTYEFNLFASGEVIDNFGVDPGCVVAPPPAPSVTTPTTTTTTNPAVPPCAVNDGRLNYWECGTLVAIYQSDDAIIVYGLDPKTGKGRVSVVIALVNIPTTAPGAPVLLGSGENSYNGDLIQVLYLPEGGFRVTALWPNRQPYAFNWAGCVVRDGRLNAWNCDAPIAVYQTATDIFIFAINPADRSGTEVIRVAKADIATTKPTRNVELGKASLFGMVVTFTHTPSGALQVNVTGNRRYEFRWWR